MEHSLPENSSAPSAAFSILGHNPYQHLVEGITEFAIFVLDVEGHIASWNEGARRLFCYEEDEIIGTPFSKLFTPEDQSRDIPQQELDLARRDGRAEDTRWHQRQDGTLFFCNGVTTALLDDDGILTGYAKVVRDETPRKQAEDQLLQSQERFNLLTRATNDTVWDWNLKTNELWWNENVVALFGLKRSPNPCRITWWYEHVHPEDRDRVIAGIHRIIDGDGQFWSDEYRCQCEDGSISYVLDRGHILRDKNGTPIRMLGTMIDMTRRKQAEQEREQLIHQAEAATRLKDEFLATLSHELRTPLQAILGYANLLRSGQLGNEDSARALETIERNAVAQSAIIEDVLDSSRILTGKIRIDVRPVDLTHCIEGALGAITPAASAKGIHLDLDLATDVGSIEGDATRLQQVMWNLLSNAIKFTPSGGQVVVSLKRLDRHVQISVTDTGQGISPQFLPHVFDRFRQADSSSTRAHSGLGLGLSIVRQMVELHGGTIEAHSDGLGQGATFTLQIPLSQPVKQAEPVEPPKGEIAASSSPAKKRELENVNVLVVEDEADARDLIRIMLQGRGARATAVGSVSAAMKTLRTSDVWPDVVVSDIGMAGEDGYAFIQQFRALEAASGHSHTPAMALTAFAREEDRSRALEAGFDQHLAKPIEATELIALVSHYAAAQYSH